MIDPKVRSVIEWVAQNVYEENGMPLLAPTHVVNAHKILDHLVETFELDKTEVGDIVDAITNEREARE